MANTLPVLYRVADKVSAYDHYLDQGDYGAAAGHWSAQTAAYLSPRQQGEKRMQVYDGFVATRVVISFMRLPAVYFKLLTGRAFWDTKYEYNATNHNYDKRKNLQHPVDILCNLCVVAARTLGPIAWLNRVELIRLGKHEKGINYAIFGLWVGILVLSAISSVRKIVDVHKEEKTKLLAKEDNDDDEADIKKMYGYKKRQAYVNGFGSTVSCVQIVADFGALGNFSKAHPIVSIATAALSIFTMGYTLLNEFVITPIFDSKIEGCGVNNS